MSAQTTISRRFLSAGLVSASLLAGAAFGQTSASSSPNQTITSDLGGLVACAESVVDQNGSGCMQANVVPTLGMLYPLSADLFVSAITGFVGMGTTDPLANLHVVGEGLFDLPGFASLLLGDSSGDPGLVGTSTGGARHDIAFTNAGLSLRLSDMVEDFFFGGSGRFGIGTNSPIADFAINNRIWMGDNAFGLGETSVMTRRADDLRGAYTGPLSTTQYTIGMHRNDGLFIGGGILQDDTTDEVSLFADVKNFRETNPRNPSTDIVYACIEGPEAAAYVRGTADLIGGMAHIELPEHFSDVAMTEGMTVHVTPRSAASRGLAVVERTKTHIVVRELLNGQGSYQFDWEVKGVRAKYENYQVVRPKLVSPLLPATPQKR